MTDVRVYTWSEILVSIPPSVQVMFIAFDDVFFTFSSRYHHSESRQRRRESDVLRLVDRDISFKLCALRERTRVRCVLVAPNARSVDDALIRGSLKSQRLTTVIDAIVYHKMGFVCACVDAYIATLPQAERGAMIACISADPAYFHDATDPPRVVAYYLRHPRGVFKRTLHRALWVNLGWMLLYVMCYHATIASWARSAKPAQLVSFEIKASRKPGRRRDRGC